MAITATFETTTVNAVVQNAEPQIVVEFTGERGPIGLQGPAGNGLEIIDELANTGELPGSGSSGDAYLISGDLWVWPTGGSSWLNVGPIQGPTGPEGPSAYEVAVSEGFVGTEAEWLASLEGPPGDDAVFPTGVNVGDVMIWDGSAWTLSNDSLVRGNLRITVGSTEPASPTTNDLWVDTT